MTRAAHLITLTTALVVAVASSRGEAHKPITSPYTYNEDVFPILRDRCGRCHVPGGIAPMSLMTYKDAFPWGESIRTELMAGHMPPGGTNQPAGAFRNTHALSAHELNVLMVWVTGGNPMGNAERTPPAVPLDNSWRLGTPDLVVPMPSAFTIAADKTEETLELTLPTGATAARLVRAVDLLPGTPAIVRSATVSVKTDSPAAGANADRATSAPERVLALWLPGDNPVALDDGPAFQLPANAELILRVHYKKTWENERLAMTDRSSVGLYFAPATAPALRALTVAAPADTALKPASSGTGETRPSEPTDRDQVSFSRIVDEDLRAVAIYPDRGMTNVNVDVNVERPDGSRTGLIRFRPQADWARRYWLAEAVTLPRGSRITVVATFSDVLLPPGAAPLVLKRPDAASLRVTVNVVGK